MSRRRLIVAGLGIALSAAAVFLLLRQVRIDVLLANLKSAKPAWLLAGCAVTIVGYWLRARRWGEILSPEARVPASRLFEATMVGFLAINTLPARLGEFFRAYFLARTERLRTATVLGSVLVERIFDLAALGVFWALSLLFAPYPTWFRWSGYLTIGLGVVVTLALRLLHEGHYDTESLGAKLRGLIPRRLKAPLEKPLASFSAGLRVLARPGTLVTAGVLTLGMWLVNGSIFLLVGQSIGLKLPLWSPFLLAFVVCVAIMVPSSPGFIGVLEGSCVVGLSLLGVEASRALAYAVLYHVTQIVPLVVFGGLYAARGHVRWGLGGPAPGVAEDGLKRKD